MNELENAVIAAGKKEYKDFEKVLSKEVQTKIAGKLKTYMDNFEKTIFNKKEKDDE